MITLKSQEEIEGIRLAGRLASRALDLAERELRDGLTTARLDKILHEFICDHGAIPACLGYRGFPGSNCVSINEEVVHGIPGSRVIRNGDLVKVDVTTILNGFYGDNARTYGVGEISPEARDLLEATRKSMYLGIAQVRDGARLGDIGAAIQGFVEPLGYSVVRDLVGHGIGRNFHEPPNVPHYGRQGSGPRLKAGMVFTIEPMINAGTWEVKTLADNWTVVTLDGRLSAQFEHTLAVTSAGADILTLS